MPGPLMVTRPVGLPRALFWIAPRALNTAAKKALVIALEDYEKSLE